jgi:hypothetical protein
MRKQCLLAAGLAAAVLATAGPAHAQGGFGLRAGVSVDPDQFYVGAHVDAGPLVKRLWFRPSLEIGFGDNLTLLALNAELAYWLPSSSPWRAYVGGGPALNVYDSDASGSETQAGLNFMLGVAHRGGFFVEAKAGVFDSPNLKFAFGYTF